LKTIYLQSWQQRYAFRGTISEVAAKLEKFNFVRVHKSYVVSLRYVKNIFKGVITMENGVKIYVSKYRSKEVYELLMQYIEAGYGS
jgi:DNA-binding LytR/AlgR family response regulator